MKKIKCLFGFHKYKDIKTQITKNVTFGFNGCEMPGYRLIRECEDYSKINYVRLNLCMPEKYLYNEKIWRN